MAAHHDNMEESWGVAASYAEHRVHDRILYLRDGQTCSGVVLWICAPAICSTRQQPVRYVVRPDARPNELELISSCNILIDEAYKQGMEPVITSPTQEQALIEVLSTLSIPITVRVETDDDGLPYYVWFIGESTPQQPWGLYVGTDRNLTDALKAALERLIKHLQR
ncbi:MAG TPA: hypothetical protein VKV40_23495 [Ktedonobacteraceae bacterium]|nr:hypothetical protein [Ktedonobacteraceae bacterium]